MKESKTSSMVGAIPVVRKGVSCWLSVQRRKCKQNPNNWKIEFLPTNMDLLNYFQKQDGNTKHLNNGLWESKKAWGIDVGEYMLRDLMKYSNGVDA